MNERRFHGAVAAWLDSAFEDVEHEATLGSGRRPDFVARTPFGGYVVEVENTAGSLYEAVGQALVYAEETGLEPVVVFPAGDAPDPEEVPAAVEAVFL